MLDHAYANILEAIGHTPLVRLNRIGRDVAAEIYVKCEYMNPGGSMKDRMTVHMVNEAEARGTLRPGGTIVEATSGNTGTGLAMIAAVRGYHCVFVMPDKMANEKIATLRASGARVVVCPTAVEPDDPRSYYSVAKRIHAETTNSFYANQYHNLDNPGGHYVSTGPEIWEQTDGQLDVFVAGLGTGGTMAGVGRYLKERRREIQLVGVDPVSSLYYDYVKSQRVTKPFAYKVEGIGEDFFPSTFDPKMLDEIVRVDDKECFLMARDLLRLKRFSNRPCTTWGGRGTSAHTDAGGPMRAYSMDRRERALLDSDAGMKAADVAAKYRVSGSWVRRLKQRRRDTGEVAPRVQRHGRRGMREPHLHTLAALIAAHPDRTLAELKDPSPRPRVCRRSGAPCGPSA